VRRNLFRFRTQLRHCTTYQIRSYIFPIRSIYFPQARQSALDFYLNLSHSLPLSPLSVHPLFLKVLEAFVKDLQEFEACFYEDSLQDYTSPSHSLYNADSLPPPITTRNPSHLSDRTPSPYSAPLHDRTLSSSIPSRAVSKSTSGSARESRGKSIELFLTEEMR
jgi:hypothetical protein